jgi:hypothetical protein
MKRAANLIAASRLLAGVVGLAAFSPVSVARADDDKCKQMSGHDVVTVVPAPNDPLGRVLGSATGDLKAAISTFLTSLSPDGSQATSVDVWALGAQDILIFNGKVTVTPIPGKPVGTVSISGTLTVAGGTGEFTGASGVLHLTGTGFKKQAAQLGFQVIPAANA